MALAFTTQPFGLSKGLDQGGIRVGLVTIDFDDSYPTNGEAVAASDIDSNFNGILALIFAGFTDGAAVAHSCVWDAENSKVIVNDFTDALEFANTTDLTGVSAKFWYVCY